MADKVYTSAEFKRERDNFTVRPANKLVRGADILRPTPVRAGLKISY